MRAPGRLAGAGLPRASAVPISRGMQASKWQHVEARWGVLRSSAGAYWSRLPPRELHSLPGDRASLVQLVKRIYALEETGAEAQVDAWVAGLPEGNTPPPPSATTKDEQRAEGEGMGVVPGAAASK